MKFNRPSKIIDMVMEQVHIKKKIMSKLIKYLVELPLLVTNLIQLNQRLTYDLTRLTPGH